MLCGQRRREKQTPSRATGGQIARTGLVSLSSLLVIMGDLSLRTTLTYFLVPINHFVVIFRSHNLSRPLGGSAVAPANSCRAQSARVRKRERERIETHVSEAQTDKVFSKYFAVVCKLIFTVIDTHRRTQTHYHYVLCTSSLQRKERGSEQLPTLSFSILVVVHPPPPLTCCQPTTTATTT